MWKDFLYYTKTERQGIIVLVVLILGVYAAPELFAFFTRTEDTGCTKNEKADQEYNDFISSLRETKPHPKSGHSFPSTPQREIKLTMFDPNTADSTTFLSLGLPPWMIKNICTIAINKANSAIRRIFGRYTDSQKNNTRLFILISKLQKISVRKIKIQYGY